ncbi:MULTISPECIES: transposase [unclassified Coleofasciculus]|uniref:transposase n=1 Tax=unclassified Coleofasciculus TaxID=2692782 RepID=UPI00187F3199|nr:MULTISPECIES: transposase [unclassified Coleofasciculus]MBE9130209.1 transposase [Coleofasciculus sp. LEGE 07081]MBE9152543.1 transposase [Coleofasciculus sp. LEGE 07092]
MAKSTTPSFVTTIPLVVTSQAEPELLSRFQGGRQLYNALLNESMARMRLVHKSDQYQLAKALPKGKARTEAFAVARKEYRYSEYDIQAYATVVANTSKWIATKIDSNTQQKLATRAFQASEKVMFGRAKKVRFKVPFRFRSMEGKTNKQGIRWVGEQLVWGKLKLNALIDYDNPVMMHGINSEVKYVRILWKEINGKRRWYAQLINKGEPYQKAANFVSPGVVGIDLNISNVAYVADSNAGLLPFAEKVPTFEREISRLQRKMQRSQRQLNPDSYEPDFLGRKGRKTIRKKGKLKKGKRAYNKSKRYLALAAKKRELERRKSEYCKSQNRRLVNDILKIGNQIKTEKVSVKGWQKNWGKAVAAKSPGFFQSELKRKAEKAGGSFYQFSTTKTALSQTHLTGIRIKKSLSERVHYDQSGVVMHRDLMSAFLSRHVYDDKLSLRDAQSEYPGMETALLRAWQQYQQSANRVSASESQCSHSPVELIRSNSEKSSQIASVRLIVSALSPSASSG